MEGNPGKKEFFDWVVANQNNLLRDYHKYIEEAETYFFRHNFCCKADSVIYCILLNNLQQ